MKSINRGMNGTIFDPYESLCRLIGPLQFTIAANLLEWGIVRFLEGRYPKADLYVWTAHTLVVLSLIWISLRAFSIVLYRFYFRKLQGVVVPRTIKKIISGTLYLFGFLGFLHFSLDYGVGDIIITTAIISFVLLVALHNLLANLLNGLVISLGKAFRIGDCITIGGFTGKVVETDWQTTLVQSSQNDFISLPNKVIADIPLINHSAPDQFHGCIVRVPVDASAPPNQVKSILRQCLKNMDHVLKRPSPEVHLVEFAHQENVYEISFWIADFTLKDKVEDTCRTCLWYHLRRYAITTGAPSGTSERQPKIEDRFPDIAALIKNLMEIPLFTALAKTEIEQLAGLAQVQVFGAGERLFCQGDEGDSLYVIHTGKVDISIDQSAQGPERVEKHICTFQSGGFFGEMSLLTGERRSAHATATEDSILIIIEKASFQRILMANPEVVGRLSAIVTERSKSRVAETDLAVKPIEHSTLLGRIRHFFKL